MTERVRRDPIQQTTPDVIGEDGAVGENGNREWRLAELVDAVAAEIDHAEDTLSLKSYARGMSFAIKQLSLDLEVTARRDEDGRILFRTVDADQSSATVLKLDFAQVLQNQLEGLRKPLDRPVDTRELATLPGITLGQITALNAIAIFSVGDLERYTQTAAMVAEVSRKTRIDDAQIRRWRQLPFFTEAKPASGPPGSTVLIEGGNLGSLRDPNAVVMFQGQPAMITSWSESRLIVTMPQARGAGVLFAIIGGQPTNVIAWEATAVDLFVGDIVVSPPDPVEGDTITVEANLVNQGSSASGTFQVQWAVDERPLPPQAHGTLQPRQRSMESSIRRQLTLGAGWHTIRFTADPARQIPEGDRANSTLAKRVEVNSLQQLAIGDFRNLDTLDPLLNENLGPADVLSLIFRGLGRPDPETGAILPDTASKITVADGSAASEPGTITFQLRDDVRFHDGSPLTAADVEFTYRRIMEGVSSPWHDRANEHIGSIRIVDERTIEVALLGAYEDLPPQLLTVGIVPRGLYEADPDSFGSGPVGSGPFQIDRFAPGEAVDLRAFDGYMPAAPRLNRIKIPIVTHVDQLTEMVRARRVNAAVLPYSEQLYGELEESGEWNLTPLPKDQPQLLHAQSKDVLERAPNSWDTNWNAYLWYVVTTAVWDETTLLDGTFSFE